MQTRIVKRLSIRRVAPRRRTLEEDTATVDDAPQVAHTGRAPSSTTRARRTGHPTRAGPNDTGVALLSVWRATLCVMLTFRRPPGSLPVLCGLPRLPAGRS
ncbi:hypothetical protein GCM10023075_12080 [Streptosporangium album]